MSVKVEQLDSFEVETEDGYVFEVGKVEISWTDEWVKHVVGDADISVEDYAEQVQTWYESKYPSLDFVVERLSERGLYEWAPIPGFLIPESPGVTFFDFEGEYIYGGDCEDLACILDVDNVFEQEAWRIEK